LSSHNSHQATAIWTVAALTAASGLVVPFRMYETHPRTDSNGHARRKSNACDREVISAAHRLLPAVLPRSRAAL